MVNRGVDFIRNAFDKHDRVPKAYWLLTAWAVGVGVAFALCRNNAVLLQLHLSKGPGCVGLVLTGAGFGSVAGFWHELLVKLGGPPASSPKGLVPDKAA